MGGLPRAGARSGRGVDLPMARAGNKQAMLELNPPMQSTATSVRELDSSGGKESVLPARCPLFHL